MKLCLPPELHLALIKFQAEHELGRPYAGLLILTKGLYQEKLISREAYELLTMRYSRKLVNEDNQAKQILTLEELQAKQQLEEKARQFSMVLNQWKLHGPEWRDKWVSEAGKWKDKVPSAKLVCDLEGS